MPLCQPTRMPPEHVAFVLHRSLAVAAAAVAAAAADAFETNQINCVCIHVWSYLANGIDCVWLFCRFCVVAERLMFNIINVGVRKVDKRMCSRIYLPVSVDMLWYIGFG